VILDFAYQEEEESGTSTAAATEDNMKDIRDTNSDEAPPNSRLFIIGAKDLTEEDFRDAFETHGTIEKIEIHRDKNGNSKGLAYIKFSKTSEAAHALEQLNGRCIGNHPRPLKVLVANNRDQNYKSRTGGYGGGQSLNGSSKEDEDRLLRLFVVVPKDKLEADIKEYFSTFGDVQYVNVVKDKETKKSRGFAYVKYYRIIHAAAAFESCDRSYKPVFAEPRPPKPEVMGLAMSPQSPHRPLTHTASSESGCCVLHVLCSLRMTEDQLWRLFDLVPGLDFCEIKFRDVRNNRAVGSAVFTNARSAMYARDKLHGFEYPPGERLIVKLDNGGHSEPWPGPGGPAVYHGGHHHQYNMADNNLVQASHMMRSCHISPPGAPPAAPAPYIYDPSYCSIALPPPQPLSHPECPVVERLFIVATPSQPPVYVVKDVFCRFGGLIDLYFLSGKRCGYALYSQEEAAKKAQSVMNGQEICGVRLKVMMAEPRKIHENAIQSQSE